MTLSLCKGCPDDTLASSYSVLPSLYAKHQCLQYIGSCAPMPFTICRLQAFRSVGLGCRNGVKADERLYSTLMEVAGQAQRVDLAFELQANMLAQGLQPSQVRTSPHLHLCIPLSHPSHSVCKYVLPCSPHTSILATLSCPSPPPPPPLTRPSQPSSLTKSCPHPAHVSLHSAECQRTARYGVEELCSTQASFAYLCCKSSSMLAAL